MLSYDAPSGEEIHIHRIGRTGRGGHRGVAYTFLTRTDSRIAGYIVESMETVGQKVPGQLLSLAKTYGEIVARVI